VERRIEIRHSEAFELIVVKIGDVPCSPVFGKLLVSGFNLKPETSNQEPETW